MLVYAPTPNGVLHLGHYRIYGKHMGHDPVDLPFKIYNLYKNGLEDGTYREGMLMSLFGKPFPIIAFTYSELNFLPEETLNTIGPLMVPNYHNEWSHKKKVDQIKLSLVNVSPPCP